MSTIKHHAIIVTSGNKEHLLKCHKQAILIFNKEFKNDKIMTIKASELISPIIRSPVGGFYSFFITPDGSKEGWTPSLCADESREKLTEWMWKFNKTHNTLSYLELMFGGDDDEFQVLSISKTLKD